MSARPTVTVQKAGKTVPLPRIFSFPIRFDVVRFAHRCVNTHKRLPYAVSRRAGHQTSAESWGTGRAVSRIPRVGGGGTHRSGQGAFGNMCRGGRMFSPTKVFRKWHTKINQKIRRIAIRAAISASAVPALVMARGHNVARVPEIPLVVSNAAESLEKTKDAWHLLKDIGVDRDVAKVKNTKSIRAGKGKRRNRRYVVRKGPLLVVSKKCPAMLAFRNLPGVDVTTVKKLELLKLAPGGHIGRLIIWTESALTGLDAELRCRHMHHVPDSKRIINSEEVQSLCRAKRTPPKKSTKRGRAILNPACVIEKPKQKKIHEESRRINSDRKLRRGKQKAKRDEKKEWFKKLMDEKRPLNKKQKK